MGNSSSKKQKKFQSLAGSSDLEYRDCSPWRRGRSEIGEDGDCPLYDVPGKPSKAMVSLTNLQSDKAAGSCVTDSIFLDWYRPPTDGGRPIIGYTVEMYDLPTGESLCHIINLGLLNELCGERERERERELTHAKTELVTRDVFCFTQSKDEILS